MLSRTGIVNEIPTKRLWLLQLDAAQAFLRTVAAGIDPGPYGMYQLVRQSDSIVVGDIGFHAPPDWAGTVTVGYGLAAQARGKGYATEALQALIGWALAQPEVRRVESVTPEGNPQVEVEP